MALFFIEHMFESRVNFEMWTTRNATSKDSNHNGRVKRPETAETAQGNSTVTTANSNHPIQILFVVSRRSLRSLLNHRGLGSWSGGFRPACGVAEASQSEHPPLRSSCSFVTPQLRLRLRRRLLNHRRWPPLLDHLSRWPQSRSTMTGAWSQAPLPARSSRSMKAPVTRSASDGVPRTKSIRMPRLRSKRCR